MSAALAGILRQSQAVARLWQKRFNRVGSGEGCYFDIDVKGWPKTLTIDFNRAYNPNCARSPHYNCPVAVEKLPVALRAGEMIPPKH